MSLDVYLECPCCKTTLYSANITHNLGGMATEAGIYDALWRPEEVGIQLAENLIAPLVAGLAALIAEPERMRKHDPPNGWGAYENLVQFTQNYLTACREYPTARVRVWR